MKKVTKKAVKKTAPKKVPGYRATIKVLGKTYEANGSDVHEAIGSLKPEGVARGASILSVSKGGVLRDKVLSSVQTFRLFSPSKLMREVALKDIALRFDL